MNSYMQVLFIHKLSEQNGMVYVQIGTVYLKI